jgi:hypothetical protein
VTTVQVFDGGLHMPPTYDVPQYPLQGFDCDSTRQLVEIVMQTGLPLATIAREHWVVNGNESTRERSLISVSVFNPDGEEIASFNPTMKRGQFHAKTNGRGRVWSSANLALTDPVDITGTIQLCRRYSPAENREMRRLIDEAPLGPNFRAKR